jgi:hypothetical protein
MLIIGCDFHPGFQQVTIFDNQTGEIQERRLGHRDDMSLGRQRQNLSARQSGARSNPSGAQGKVSPKRS